MAAGEDGPKLACQLSGTKRQRTYLKEIGWGGRIRTSTVLINSEVSYRLDHAPAAYGVSSAAGTTDGGGCF